MVMVAYVCGGGEGLSVCACYGGIPGFRVWSS